MILLAIVAGLTIALGVDIVRAGGPARWIGRFGLPAPYIASGERFDVGGRSLYLDCRGSGSPTIVLEAGMGDDSAAWTHVHDDLAGLTRTCSYDRAGRGRSDAAGLRTMADAATDLRTLLRVAGERGPFIVAGHSLGAAYARVFGAAYPAEVEAVVLVDGFNPDLQSDHVHPLLGDLRPEYDRSLQGLRDLVASVERLEWATGDLELRGAALVGMPIAVLVAPRREPRLDEATNERIEAAWRAGFESLSPGLVEHEIAWGAGHYVQNQRPDLVVAHLRRLVELARDG